MIVFLVSGLWHGAQFSFIVWGGINGLYQIIGEILQPIKDKAVDVYKLQRRSLAHKMLQMTVTFALVDFSWIFFRANNFSDAIRIIKSIVTSRNINVLFDDSLYNCGLDIKNFMLALLCIGILLLADCCKRKGIVIRKVIASQDRWFRCLFIVFCVCSIMLFGKWGHAFDKASFIYFQF